MRKPQYVYKNGKQANAQARRLIKSVGPSKDALEQTVEMRSAQDVVCKPGRFGCTYYVRSSFSPVRYYPVIWDNERNAWSCTCHQQCRTHKHSRMVNAYIQAQKEVVA